MDDESYSAVRERAESCLPFALNFFMLSGVKRLRIIVPVLFALAAGLWWVLRQNAADTFIMPDGNRFHFLGVTLGTNVQINLGSPVEKILGHLPGKLGRRYRRNVWTEPHTQPALEFWFEFDRAPSTNLLTEVKFKEVRHFTNFWPVGWLPAQTLPNGRILASCSFYRWPQQEKTFVVEIGTTEDKPRALWITTANGEEFLDEPGEFMKLGELTVKNPGY